MAKAPKLIAAVEKASRDLHPDEHRNHLGASTLGDTCMRRVQLKYLWAAKENFSGRMRRLFNRGHREEGRIITTLRQAGVTVYDAGESGELKEQLRISFANGHGGGTPDGVVTDVPDLVDTPCLLEMKTMNQKYFEQITASQSVFQGHLKYWVQMQIYMYKHDLKWALFIAVNKNDDDWYVELVEAKPSIAKEYLARAEKIIFEEKQQSKVSSSPGWWECKLCKFKDICHNDVQPEQNCRTCVNGRPGKDGKWHCKANQPEIETDPQHGCEYYALNTKLFVDGPPF